LFCGHNTLTEGLFVTQVSGNAGVSVARIMCVTTNFCSMRDTDKPCLLVNVSQRFTGDLCQNPQRPRRVACLEPEDRGIKGQRIIGNYLTIDTASYAWNLRNPRIRDCWSTEEGGNSTGSDGGHQLQNEMSSCPGRHETDICLFRHAQTFLYRKEGAWNGGYGLTPRSHVPVFDRPVANRPGECTTWDFKTSPVLTGRSNDEERSNQAVVRAQ
jgi:hypothetical protein